MKVAFKVVTPTTDKEPGSTYHLKKTVEWDTSKAPVPQKDDQVFISGVFINIRLRCITNPSDWSEKLEEMIELFATVEKTCFEQLEEAGWQRD